MNNTLKLFSTLITPEYQNLSLEELAVVYTEGLNPSVLATAFSKLYNLIHNVSTKYYGLSSEDIASFSVEELDRCLQIYDSNKGAFSTVYTTYLMNRFRKETEALNTQKRRANLLSESYEALFVDNGIDIPQYPEQDYRIAMNETMEVLSDLGLTTKELKYCELTMMGFKNKEIADMLSVSVMTISNIRKRLREKVTPETLYCY